MSEGNKVKNIREKLELLRIQFSKGYGVYSLVPDRKGQFGKFLKENNLKVTESAGDKVASLFNYFEENKKPTVSKIKEAESVLSKWFPPLKKLDAMSAEEYLEEKRSTGRKSGKFTTLPRGSRGRNKSRTLLNRSGK